MKNFLLLLCLCFGSVAFGREVTSELVIYKGPYYVPVTSEAFNVLGPDFKSKGEALAYLTNTTINFEFSRLNLISLELKRDDGNYFFGRSTSGTAVRIGIEGNNLSWFYSKGDTWDVKIDEKSEKNKVAPTPFAKMSDEQLLGFAKNMFDEGSIDQGSVKHLRNGNIVLTANVLQMGADDDEPHSVGIATFTFFDTEGARTIQVKATVKDRK